MHLRFTDVPVEITNQRAFLSLLLDVCCLSFSILYVLLIYVARRKVWSVSSLWGLEMHMTETSPPWSHIDSIFGSQRESLPIRDANDNLTYLHYKKIIIFGLITPWPSSRSIVFIVLCLSCTPHDACTTRDYWRENINRRNAKEWAQGIERIPDGQEQ